MEINVRDYTLTLAQRVRCLGWPSSSLISACSFLSLLIFPLIPDEGNWSSGQMHGKGIKTLRNGDRYSGLWSCNQANGFGVKTFAAGDVHEGEYKDDLRHGYGQYKWKSGDRFEGVVSGTDTHARAFL